VALNSHPGREWGIVLHAILVDGVIEKIEGTPDVAEAEVLKQRKAGRVSEYLFAAKSEEEFEQKKKKTKYSVQGRFRQ
jgi:hypothetical protein